MAVPHPTTIDKRRRRVRRRRSAMQRMWRRRAFGHWWLYVLAAVLSVAITYSVVRWRDQARAQPATQVQ